MTKKDIILAVHQKMPHYSQKFLHEAVDLFFSEIADCLVSNGSVELRGFGNFVCKQRASYVGINPKTQEKIRVPQKKIIIFKMSSLLKHALIHKTPEKRKFFSGFYRDWTQFKRRSSPTEGP
jgi:integration host factor subunit alpha